MNEELLAIARRLGFDTLEIRNSDRLDFHEVAVWQVRDVLEAAYVAGKRAAKQENDPAPGGPENDRRGPSE